MVEISQKVEKSFAILKSLGKYRDWRVQATVV